MLKCGCGRQFANARALDQHRQAKAQLGSSAEKCRPSRSVPTSGGDFSIPRAQGSSQAAASGAFQNGRDGWMARRLWEIIHTIDSSSLQPAEATVSSSTGSEVICSYNWVNRPEPAIYVPGSPPAWKAASLPITLQRDSKTIFIDESASRIPKYPFEVVFQATAITRPSFRFDDIDVLSNRNSLRKLLDFCYGRCRDSFLINLHMVHNTLIIERCEKNAKNMIHGSGWSGFGHSFERAFTQLPKGLEDSSSHHRVLLYSLGGLNCAVRFEVDAYYEDPAEAESSDGKGSGKGSQDETTSLLLDSFNSLQVSPLTSTTNPAPPPPPSSPTQIIPLGTATPHTAAAELKTHTKGTSLPLAKILPQLWFGRIPHLLTGHHTNGTIERVDMVRTKDRMEAWERGEANQLALRKLAGLVERLRDVVRGADGRACVAVCRHGVKPANLQVFVSRVGRRALGEEVVGRFWAGGVGSS